MPVWEDGFLDVKSYLAELLREQISANGYVIVPENPIQILILHKVRSKHGITCSYLLQNK
jgi:hypothetical protein